MIALLEKKPGPLYFPHLTIFFPASVSFLPGLHISIIVHIESSIIIA